MPDHGLLAYMYLAYLGVGAVFLLVVSAVMIWLFATTGRRGAASTAGFAQEFVWTLVPALVVASLTVLGEVPHGWVKIAAGPRAAEGQSRVLR